MRSRTKALSDAAKDVLSRVRVEGNRVHLPTERLDRSLYSEVNDALARAGGNRTSGKVQAHVFPGDPSAALVEMLGTGKMLPKNVHDFFPTPDVVADALLEMVGGSFLRGMRTVLEPSAGNGALVDALARQIDVTPDVCEIDPAHLTALSSRSVRIIGTDFVACEPCRDYDLIVMNPPFTTEGDPRAWATHCARAWSLVAPGGRLAAIVPANYDTLGDAKSRAFARMAADHLVCSRVLHDAFRESGTAVPVALLVLAQGGPR